MLVTATAPAATDITNKWDFTNYIYTLSNPLLVEINTNSTGFAQLILDTKNKYYSTLADYSNASYRNLIGMGYDSFLRLTGLPGAYSTSGSFISRVLDGGGGVNTWQMIYGRASNRYFANSKAETLPGLVGLWHNDNNWLDATTNANNGSGINGVTFSTSARFGVASGSFDGINDYVTTPKSYVIGGLFSISFWVKVNPDIDTKYASVAFGFTANKCSILLGGKYLTWEPWRPPYGITVFNSGQTRAWTSVSNTFLAANDAGVWRHVVITYDKSIPRMKVYKDGVALASNLDNYDGGDFAPSMQPIFGYALPGGVLPNDAFSGLIDEVALFNRVLSQEEVIALYNDYPALTFRVRSGTTSDLSSKNFVGPDGTTNSFYVGVHEALQSGGDFNVSNQFAQYKAEFSSSAVWGKTPYLESVGLFGSVGVQFDNNNFDFDRGTYSSVTNPVAAPAPSLGVAKNVNGGYFTNGTYTSRVLDANGPVTWDVISWKDIPHLSSSLPGLVGLWYMDWGWGSEKGSFAASWSGGATFSYMAKLGNGAGLFNGTGAKVDITVGASIQALDFWIKDANVKDGIMEVVTASGTAYLSISNHIVSVQGSYGTSGKLYINGESACAKIMNGWNHVALVFGQALTVNSISLGVANGDFMDGMLDELAAYNYAILGSEINDHFTSGRRQAGGSVQAYVQYGSSLPLTTNTFYGPYSKNNSLFLPTAGQYLQYTLVFAGDGDSAPLVDSVTISHNGAGSPFIDDTQLEIAQGTFGGGHTIWYGDEIRLLYPAGIAPPNIVPDISTMSLWHMDEATWTNGGSIVADAKGARPGTPYGDAKIAALANVGSFCGSFDGNGDYVDLKTISLGGDFTFSAWFNTTNSSRAALVSSDSGGGSYFTMEVNGNGSAPLPGRVAFTVNNGVTTVTALANRSGLNDGQWHNAVGVRSTTNGQIHIYIDGEREGAANTGTAFGSLGANTVYAAARPMGSPDLFFKGLIDEVCVWSKALSEAEIGNNFSGGYMSQGTGEYISEAVNATNPAVWREISWTADGPYSKPLAVGGTLAAVWHMEEPAGDILNSVSANNGVVNGATPAASGRFGNCLDFNGLSSFVRVEDDSDIEPPNITVEAWINADTVTLPGCIIDKSGGGNGYVLGLDPSGKPYFKVGASNCTSYLPVRAGKWTHVAGCYDTVSSKLRLYVDGELAAATPGSVSAGSGQPLFIGRNAGASEYFDGLIDEVAIHSSALGGEEILDHYRAGAVTLKLQARSSYADPTFAGIPFIGPNKSNDTFFTESGSSSLTNIISLGQYFQYRAYIATENYKLTPRFCGVRVYVANYPTTDPTVEPDSGHAVYFPGRLKRFTDVPIPEGAGANVKYQISGDSGPSPTWYYWDSTKWASNAPADYIHASTQSDIDQNITNFFDLFYPKSGGNFRFRAFLHSLGDYQMQVDRVNFVASAGRIVVTVPNGDEIGTKNWIVGTPQTIRWTTDGIVSTNLEIALYKDSGSNLVSVLGTGLPNSSNYTVKISDEIGTRYRINIRDINDSSIYDMSDNDFWLSQDFHLITPDGGEYWRLGQTNTVVWDSPGPDILSYGSEAWLWYSDDGGASWFDVSHQPNAIGRNQYLFCAASNDARFVSENARMGVSMQDAPSPVDAIFPGDISDGTFVMAGIAITYPTLATPISMGKPTTIFWKSAGAGTNGVRIDFAYDGVNWTNLTMNAACVPGTNSYPTVLNAPNPSQSAKLRITANEFPAVWSESFKFTLADISIISPKGSYGSDRDQWPIGSTNYIKWTSGGAGSSIDIEYSTDYSNWITIVTGYTNINSEGTVITNISPPWIIPGPPSSNASVRLKSGGLTSFTDPFNMTGLKVTSPNGGEIWDFGVTTNVTWEYMGPANIDIKIAYVDNPTTNDYEAIVTGVSSIGRSRTILPGMMRRPTNYGRIRISATTNQAMYDVSDNMFKIKGLLMTYPKSNAVYTMGVNVVTGLQWYTAWVNDTVAELYFATDGSNFNELVMSPQNMYDDTTSFNALDWQVPTTILPSDVARLKVVAGTNQAISSPFVLRGIRVLSPAAGEVFDIGTNKSITWKVAGHQGTMTRLAGALSTAGTTGLYSTAGLNTNVAANIPGTSFGGMAWNINSDLVEPTTSAVIRLSCFVPTNDVDLVMYSDPFTLRGMKFVTPSGGTNWTLGNSVNVSFRSAGMGVGAMASIYYSPDGVTFDMAKPVTNNMYISDGLNTMTWNIENSSALTRMPSTNAVLKIVSGGLSSVSQPFTLGGIKVTTPAGSEIWAVTDGTNTIKWIGVNTVNAYDLTYTIWSGTVPISSGGIASGVPGFSYDWTMPTNSVGSNVTISITDGTVTGESEKFEIVSAPSIRIISPAAGDYWKVNETNNILWIQGGRMSNNFVLSYSAYPFTQTNTPKIGAFDSTNNIFSYPWVIPNALGQMRIVITNINNVGIADQFENFKIAPKFDITPFGTNVYALKSEPPLSWVTYGDVSAVDLYYSVDPLRGTNNWHKINTVPYTRNVGNTLPASTNITIPNIRTNSMWMRVQDSSYSEMFDASKPGPYDDTGPFTVRYYTIVWNVIDAEAIGTQRLDAISMQDDLGWSASDLTSPITHEYPYGTWTAVFYRQFFDNLPVLNWDANPSRTINVTMQRSRIEPDPHVLTTFAFDYSNRTFAIHSWLERNGQILTTPSQCVISVYKSDGTIITAITNSTCDLNGVFWQQWTVPAIYTVTDVFFAKVEIKFSGTIYSAGLTFTLRLPAGEETVQAIDSIVRAVTADILTGVNSVNANVSNVVTAIGSIGGSVSNLTSIAQGISDDVTKINTNILALTNALLPGINLLTNAMTVIEPAITNTLSAVTNMVLDDDIGRILLMTTTVSLGSTNRVLYKTRKGYDSSLISITVQSTELGLSYSGNMTEVVPGIYEKELVASWGIGRFTVTCSDPRGHDSMALTVTGGGGLEGVPSTLSAVTNTLASIEVQIANVTNSIKGTDLSGVLASIDEVKAAVTGMKGTDLSSVEGKLNTLAGQIGAVSDSSSADSFFGQLARLNDQLSGISYNAAEAFKKARAAQGEASSAGGAVGSLKTMLEKGDVTGVTAKLDDIRKSMEAARENMKDVAKFSRIGELYDALNSMAKDMEKLAASEQFKLWTKAPTEKTEIKEGAVPVDPDQAVKTLTTTVDQMRSSLEFLQKLMSEKYEPVIMEELQGVSE